MDFELTTNEPVKDFFLVRLVVAVNLSEEEDHAVPVTLVTSGTVITGWVIPMWKWLDEAFSTDVFKEDGAKFKEEVVRAKELLTRENGEEDLSEEDAKFLDRATSPSFICMRDVKFQGGIGAMYPSDSGVPMRVRLSSVDAWTLGLFGSAQDPA